MSRVLGIVLVVVVKVEDDAVAEGRAGVSVPEAAREQVKYIELRPGTHLHF